MTSRGRTVRPRAVASIAFAQLRRSPGRTLLAVLAVGIAVLSVTLLASLGAGVVDAGEDGLDTAGRDIWISGDPVDTSTGGGENSIVGSHEIARDVSEREDVSGASPIAMHEIYVGTEPDELRRLPAVGVQRTHAGFDFEEGGGFETSEDAFADGRTTEPATEEIVLDPAVADELGVSVGDTIYVGTSRETAPDAEFTVVGTSSYYSQFLGSETATLALTDLQAITGTTGTDRATFITANVTDDADQDAVRDDLEAEYPEYDVHTSDEQIGAMLADRPVVIASGFTLVGLAILGGTVLTVNLFALVTYQQRTELAALRAIGLSRWLLAGTIGTQGVVIGVLGGLIGLAATPPLAAGLNYLSASVVGFDELLQTPLEVYAVGLGLAIGLGAVVAAVTGWRAGQYARIEHLEE
ncbi:ABC transporter permease [Natrarchaeobius chitinivorans]|uniref:ABC transporter permease n=1 Tax=Natrarchaeobius chitinivorans TaxID=1679083 RepID=A0A3N6M143_NATCH|nr:ABC transporter permease [Natrarchaeobius chitinivorans]RQG97018.1 ABC transporter permease [Natrarchaeobius chitinivorans]